MVVYLNIKTSEGVETIDELSQKDFNSYKDFRIELRRLLKEYRLSGSFYSGIYTSKRSTKQWRQK